jgi:Ca-activated chloride channel family protein
MAFGLVPLMVLGFLLLLRWKKAAISRLGDRAIVQQLMPEVSRAKQVARFILFTLAFCFLALALVDPQVGSKEEEASQEGIDVMVCLDVSNSMKAEDIAPNRLSRSVMAISKLIDRLHGDRIGIVVFAGDAFTQLPITSDYGSAKLMLDNIDNDIVPVQGTAIGTAIDMAVTSLTKNELSGKAIIVITDGENHEDDAVSSAKKAAEKGITVHTIGIGSPEGSPIPEYDGKVRVGFKKDMEGNTVVTRLNEKMLTDISAAGNGIYVRANNSEVGLNTVMNELEKVQRSKLGTKHFTDYEDRFQPFLICGLILLVAEMMLTERKMKWWTRLDLFGENKK